MAEISDALAQMINNLSPGHQLGQIGTRLQEALAGELPAGSIGTAEIADSAITSAKIGAGEVASVDIAANAVTLAKISTGLMVGIAVEDAKTTSREENVDGLASAIALANSLKTITNAHAADAAEHTTAADTVNYPVTTDDATDLTDLLPLVGALLTAYDAHDADAELGAAWAFHVAQETGDHSLVSAVTPTTLEEAVTRLNDLKAKYNAHDADATAHTTGSTHQEATADAAYGAAIAFTVADVLAGDLVVWSILNSGTGTVVGVSAVPSTDLLTITFDADPQNDAVINYAVFREAS